MSDFSPLSSLNKLMNRQPAQSAPATLGRFELQRILGKGAQSVVWLAFDPRLERQVAIKLMKLMPDANAQTIAQWLQEARSVSRLAHPNLVPLFEADVHESQPYLVFEFVEGQTLAALLRSKGAIAAVDAVGLMVGVLDALIVAHEGGVIHRDLKPSNVMIDPAGRARVMDFGIAARASRENGDILTTIDGGTPGYISPEAARREAASPSMDIFSAGIVLTEMLSGKPLIAERDPARAVHKVLDEQLKLPKELSAEVNDNLRAILLRAIHRDGEQRHASVKVFRDELVHWLEMASGSLALARSESTGSGSATLEFLLRRMRHKTDFPAMSDSIVRIQGLASSETESIGSVTNEILKDVALTNKLLRLVNSAHFGRGGNISTVSRAVSLIGFNGIRNMALSLVLLEHMQDKVHAGLLKEEYLRSLMAGSIAAELTAGERASEEAFIGTMFQNLGRLLCEFYFPEEAQTVRSLVHAKQKPVSESTASAGVLGLSFEALGLGVAKVWGLPEMIQGCIRKPVGAPPARKASDSSQTQRWLAVAANEVADLLLNVDPQYVDQRLESIAKHYAPTLGVSPLELKAATAAARLKLIDLAAVMDLNVAAGSRAARLFISADTPAEGAPNQTQETSDSLSSLALRSTLRDAQIPSPSAPKPASLVAETLAAGIQDITNAMVDDFKLTDVLRMILETMFRSMNFRRVIFCMRDPKTDTLTGRFGLGHGVEGLIKGFGVPLAQQTPDLFAAVCLKGADTMISDASEQRIAKRLPAWYLRAINAPTFLLLPLVMKGRPFGLIYADMAEKGELVLDDKELALLRTLRNQAVMAFRQSS